MAGPLVALVLVSTQPVVSEWLDSGHSAGAFSLARLRWGSDLPRSSFGFRSAWNHDYPRAERHLSLIIRELTFTRIRTDGDVVLALDDPDLFSYPIVMMWEPGFWSLTDREAESFRAYHSGTRLPRRFFTTVGTTHRAPHASEEVSLTFGPRTPHVHGKVERSHQVDAI